MINKRKIHFKQVDKLSETKAKQFIIKEYSKHYLNRISKAQYNILYQKMGILLSDTLRNAFFIAYNENHKIIGAISISFYDNRIDKLKKRYQNKNIAEIGRCYVNEEYRRCGIGSKLFELAKSFAHNKSYEKLYLHTHYFLPGGYHFWQKMGFKITLDEKNNLQTVHMERNIRKSQDYSNFPLFEELIKNLNLKLI
jgi:GNAT superfamily N-acetyltransferase